MTYVASVVVPRCGWKWYDVRARCSTHGHSPEIAIVREPGDDGGTEPQREATLLNRAFVKVGAKSSAVRLIDDEMAGTFADQREQVVADHAP